jgi:hypothetical protein
VEDWRLVVCERARDGAVQVVIHLVARSDVSRLALDAAAAVRAVAGALPTQIVFTHASSPTRLTGAALPGHLLVLADDGRAPTA